MSLINQSRSIEGTSDECATRIIAETVASAADMVDDYGVEKYSSPNDHVERNDFVPFKSLDESNMKRT